MPALPNALAPQTSPLKAQSFGAGPAETRDATRNTPRDTSARSFQDTLQDQSDQPRPKDVEIDSKFGKEKITPVSDTDDNAHQTSLTDIASNSTAQSLEDTSSDVSQEVSLTTPEEGFDLEMTVSDNEQLLTIANPEAQTSQQSNLRTQMVVAELLQRGPDAALVTSTAELQTKSQQAGPVAATVSSTGELPQTTTDNGKPPSTPTLTDLTTGAAPAANSAADTPDGMAMNSVLAGKPSAQASADGTVVNPTSTAESDASAPRPTPTQTHVGEQALDLSDRAAHTKTAALNADAARTTDAAANAASSGDSSAPLKSLPVTPSAPAVTPLPAASDRLAASILQSTQMNTPVTLDKIPQAVVTVALTSRSATLQIDPPELGRIQLDYQFDTQGRTVVTLTPESDAARAALAERMSTITAALQAQTNGEVNVKLGSPQDFGTDQNNFSNSDNSDGGQQSNGSSAGSAESHQSSNDRAIAELQRYAEAVSNGENTRLHILV